MIAASMSLFRARNAAMCETARLRHFYAGDVPAQDLRDFEVENVRGV